VTQANAQPPRALRLRHLRWLGIGLAAGQAVSIPGVWLGLPSVYDDGISLALVWISGSAAAACACLLVVCFGSGDRVSRTERATAALLVLVPLVCAVVAVLMLFRHSAYDHSRRHMVVFLAVAALLFHALPALVLCRAFHRRRTRTELDWTPQESTPFGRAWAITGALVIGLGWTALFGCSAVLILWVYLFSGSNSDGPAELLMMTAVIYPVGMVVGLFCAALVAPIARSSRTDLAIPYLVCLTLGVGTVASAVFPLLGLVVVPVTLLVVSLAVRRQFPVFPPGCCLFCGYDLSRVASGICPECGKPAALSTDPVLAGPSV
jgi:hypothetical protein